ncbi:hypothetical protein H5P28_12155 [Ruficoccus amylovorans]|uniref:Magnesium transporter MgtE intracellular domain-containing protein n=1 Tax=Ruficoccus amylovorans TaxID=1804625 RepID=A0A842HIH0_9BACT|nr:hypothetical protein [Ruficoccus amylovorans]MBC2595011.1 hypothetical protein [Ruficoccus amylovorans]
MSIAGSAGLLWLRREAWMPPVPVPGTTDPTALPKEPLPGMSMAFTEWDFHVSEVEALRKKMEEERAALETERTRLAQEAARIRAEKEDLERIRQDISQLQDDIGKHLVVIEAGEKDNLKKLAQVYAGMKASEAEQIISRLEIPVAVKIIALMPEDVSSRILGVMVTGGEASTQRAAEISDEIRRLKP